MTHRPLKRFRQWEHSLSVTLLALTVASAVVSLAFEPGTRACDLWLGASGSFGTALVLTFLSRFTWERDANPIEPPRE